MATLTFPEGRQLPEIPEPYLSSGYLFASATDRELPSELFTGLPTMGQLDEISYRRRPREVGRGLTAADIVTDVTQVTHPELYPRFSAGLHTLIQRDFAIFLKPESLQLTSAEELDEFDLNRGVKAFLEAAPDQWRGHRRTTVSNQALRFSNWLVAQELSTHK